MTILFNQNGYTVKRHDNGFPIGVEYRVSDGLYECSLGECPELNIEAVTKLMDEYITMRYEDLRADEAICGEL